ncbi:C1q-related factor-like [Acanthochromis polyacanthus]|uniref:C1q-related factor-like n=1 Tax=Acanthochromis polyacanthus TaxID=80966 RepID=UPI0022343811|nr:C1q-related factor-like [Acanthochromis polyacanthus]
MRALVLLCLLPVALARKYDWNPRDPNRPTSTPDPNAVNACQKTDQYCGCCMMVQETNRLQMYFNEVLNMVEEEYNKTEQYLNMINDSRIAFSVALNNESKMNCIGPFRENTSVIYRTVFLNLGDGYNMSTGVFTVPRSGVYSLALTVYSDAGTPGGSLAACATLQVNGKVVAGPSERNMQDQEDSVTIVVALHLKAGDKVAVNLPIGCFLCDDKSHYNTFSGFLLYCTE